MRTLKLPIIKICLLGGMLLLTSNVWGEATLVSIKKGGEADRSWAVLTFDEKALWVGVSQTEGDKLSLYFMGSAGEMDGRRVSFDPVLDREIVIRQISRNPSIFRADIICDGETPLAVLKKNRNVVVSFNDERLLKGKITPYHEDVSATPGRLVNITPAVRKDRVMTSFQFDGSFEWVGYVRLSRDQAVLIIRGAELFTADSDFSFEEGYLKTVRLFTEEGDTPGLKAEMLFAPSSSFSIVKKARHLMVETPYFREQKIRQVEASAVSPSLVTFGLEEQKAPVEEWPFEPKEESVWEEPDELVEQKIEEPKVDEIVPVVQKEEGKIEREAGEGKELRSETEYGIPWDDIVSFRFSSTPIKDALRIVARANGLNMVLGGGVEGMVTMNLEGVTLRQALNKIVHTHDCEYIVEQNIITVKPVAVAYMGGRVTKVYRLKYADAANVARVIKQVVSNDSLVQVFYPEFLNFLEAGKNRMQKNAVAIQGIRRSSVLVVTERPEKIREVDEVIRELDKAPVQIMIESKLVELSPMHTSQLGINWDKTLTTVLNWQEVLPGGDAQSYSVVNTSPDRGGEWRMGHLSASQFKAVLDFLQESTDSKLISNPRLLAMDNEESSISVGTTVPVPRIQRGMGGTGDMVTFEYKEINIQLNVTPHLAPNGEITMYVNPVIEEISGWVEYEEHRAPITDKRSVNSIVSVRNGETVVIGGLIKNQRIRTKKKVWFLGSLPLLGQLFQHVKYEDKQSDLMIFITPTIVRTG